MLSRGGIEVGHLFSSSGLACAYGASFRIEHLIPLSRLEASYFTRLIIGILRSQMTREPKYGAGKGPTNPQGRGRRCAASCYRLDARSPSLKTTTSRSSVCFDGTVGEGRGAL